MRTDNRAGPHPFRVNHQRLLLDNLELIDQIVRTTVRRRHMSTVEGEDFAGFVRLRLVEDDYAILRKFQNRSTLWTYLAAVIERLSLDFYTARWGRWRPSAMAERLGPIATLLERMVGRDGHTLEEAMEMVRTNHAAAESYAELRRLWAELPVRVKHTEVGEEAAAGVRSDASAASAVDDAERQARLDRLGEVLQASLAAMPAKDRVLIGLRFDHDLPITDISKLTGQSVATLHRRLEASLKELRQALARADFDPREVSGLIGHPSMALSPLLRAEVERFLKSVRLSKQDG
jgi:RNA polymerase sigma factor for flagellar operon FliA